jgi:molybdopterin molybdotransferase
MSMDIFRQTQCFVYTNLIYQACTVRWMCGHCEHRSPSPRLMVRGKRFEKTVSPRLTVGNGWPVSPRHVICSRRNMLAPRTLSAMTPDKQHEHSKPHHDRPHRHHYDAEMLSVEEARERILSYFSRLDPVEVDLIDALDMVLAEDLVAPFDVPPLPNSAMDGYVVLSSDLVGASASSAVELPVAFTVAAGALPEGPLVAGSVVRIMTGAPLPQGADAVVPFEDTDELERRAKGDVDAQDSIGIKLTAKPGDNIRAAGEDIAKGEMVLKAGTRLRPGAIGVAASLGRGTVRAYRRPVVAIISTGDELMTPGEPHQPGKIYNSNAYSIAAEVKRYGGIPKISGIAKDTIESLQERLAGALATADMIVTSAGVSKGDYDIVKDVLAKNGAIALWSVRMRPAKPLAFGTLNGPGGRKVPHLGLPGNPVSAMVAFEQFGRAAIHVMMGRGELPKPTVQAILDDPVNNFDGRRVYARVIVYQAPDGVLRARSTGTQSSGALTSMAFANGLAICPDDVSKMEAGETVTVEMLDWPEDVFPHR